MLVNLQTYNENVPKAISEERMLIGCICTACKNTTDPFYIYPDDFEKWQNGELAQKAFPYLTPTQREILISELCEHCQEQIFSTTEE